MSPLVRQGAIGEVTVAAIAGAGAEGQAAVVVVGGVAVVAAAEAMVDMVATGVTAGPEISRPASRSSTAAQ